MRVLICVGGSVKHLKTSGGTLLLIGGRLLHRHCGCQGEHLGYSLLWYCSGPIWLVGLGPVDVRRCLRGKSHLSLTFPGSDEGDYAETLAVQ
ncbi:hypothetical protein Y032_0005g2720 [Ancylostoma ceylanicum]|uniref:Uncharacterized protein n=1 Tax=Ancylostoma ceylanicum TaxID=53326 RepID=A0A016VTF4_9BILA|nr:hypothetical protein Y032_0005g2720 [Ancylostoma ceylanicum]